MKSNLVKLCVVTIFLAPKPSIASGRIGVNTCDVATMIRPGIGVKYSGFFHNDDYKIRAIIPKGQSAWSGVDQMAPFHGFAIYPAKLPNACIILEINLRVISSDGDNIKNREKVVHISGGTARQSVYYRRVDKTEYVSIRTAFSYNYGNNTYDGIILLVSPTGKSSKLIHMYEKFLSTMRLG